MDPTLGPDKLTTGSAVGLPRGGRTPKPPPPVFDLPLTAAKDVTARWEDLFLCAPGKGRHFQKVCGEERYPYVLMYDYADDLN